ncbi:MAG: YdcF family protein [Oscillospiraceae bacterium]
MYIGLIAYILSFSTTSVSYDEDVVIVLGAGVRNGKVSRVLQNRLDACVDYYKLNPKAYIVVTGGVSKHSDTTEAFSMREYLVEQGLPYERIFLEDKSQSTKENYAFTKILLEENSIPHNKIAFITNSFHMYRGKMYAEFCGFSGAVGISTRTDAATFLPAVLREVLGVIDMWLFKLK